MEMSKTASKTTFLVFLMAQGCLCLLQLKPKLSLDHLLQPPYTLPAYGPCNASSCCGIEGPESFELITTHFRDNFYTKCDIIKMNYCLRFPHLCDTQAEREKLNISLDSTCSSTYMQIYLRSAASDNDHCCATRRGFEVLKGWKQDKDSNWCFIITLDVNGDSTPDLFQAAQTGVCDLNLSNGCTGTCRSMSQHVTLACYPQGGTRVTFRMFKVDAYCSCQS